MSLKLLLISMIGLCCDCFVDQVVTCEISPSIPTFIFGGLIVWAGWHLRRGWRWAIIALGLLLVLFA